MISIDKKEQCLELFRKIWQWTNKYVGKCQNREKGVFSETCVTAEGNKSLTQCEKHCHISKYGVDTIMSKNIPDKIDNKWSESSDIKLNDNPGKVKYNSDLEIALLKSIIVEMGRKGFAEACSIFEDDSFILLR